MSEPLLEMRELSKRFGGVAACAGLSLAINRGEIHALIGPNGAGKTTLISLLSGALRSDAGRIVFEQIDVTSRSVHERVAMGLARSYQITSVFGALSVLDNVAFAVQAVSGSSFAIWRPVRGEPALFEQARAVLDEIGLAHRAEHVAAKLAHGEQRQLEVGLALATAPKLLLLDEPMAGMSEEESSRMIELIARFRAKHTVLLVEHDMDAVFALADRISVLVSGRVIATGTRQEIRDDPQVRAAYLGEDVEA
jgi:branched-chain amino acid transport system ATP-binding protein